MADPVVYFADDYSTPNPGGDPVSGGLLVRPFKYTLIASPTLATGDTIKLVQLCQADAPGFIFVGFDIELPILDTASEGAALALQVGDSTAAARYMGTTQTGTAGRVTAARLFSQDVDTPGGAIKGTLPVSYNAQDDLILTIQTAATTPATSGVIKGFVFYAQMGEKSL